jgi:hypothetical protein
MPREHTLLKLADEGSKLFKSSNEYGISDKDFKFIEQFFNIHFEVDAFATAMNNRTDKFISYIPQLGAYDLNFFMHEMKSNILYYCHPPVSMITRCIKKILLYDNVQAVVICPLWKSNSFFTFFHKAGIFSSYIKGVLRFNPFFISSNNNTTFKGHKNFDSIALYIDTSTVNSIPYEL